MMKKVFCLSVSAIFIGLAMVVSVHANNIQVGTPTLTAQNTIGGYVFVQFDLSWDNSWRTNSAPNNWDAAWVFVKFKVTGGNWTHATLNTSGHSITTDHGVAATITTPSDGKGVFLYRTDNGMGSNNWGGVKLRWNYGTDGVADDATVTVKVFAIEMVHIPSGNFYLGDANISTGNEHYGFHKYGTTGPYQVTGEGEINIGPTANYLWAQLSFYVETSTLPAAFPKGYNAFYCMKYEISQGQYADFLNTLTATQDGTRFPNQNGNYRHTIGGSQGSRNASVPDRACNYLSWADGCAYADWACLRPMTELEFEKICRGPNAAVDNEFAWGNANVASDAYTLNNDGQPNETVSNAASDPTGNASYDATDGSINGPLRCGIFATGSSTRITAGASYYGVMEMTGNLWERPVTVANSTGRAFTGAHGDGALDATGNADVSNWPGTDALGTGNLGNSWENPVVYLGMADRTGAGYTRADRLNVFGWRGVRVAP